MDMKAAFEPHIAESFGGHFVGHLANARMSSIPTGMVACCLGCYLRVLFAVGALYSAVHLSRLRYSTLPLEKSVTSVEIHLTHKFRCLRSSKGL